MKSPHAEFYVIRDDVADKIVSVLLAHDNPNLREKYVSVLVTRPEYRKHGIGKFLIKLFTGFTEGGYIIRFDFPAKHHLFKLYAESGAHINSKPSIGGTLSGFGVVPNREGVKKKLIIPR
jgi:GNAT superfamily N-acetyltransferase